MLKTAGKQGNLKKTITVVSNDPKQKNLVLEMKGVVMVDVMFEPHSLTFAQLSKGQAGEKELSITVPEPDKVKVTGVTVDDPRFRLEKTSGDLAADSKWKITFPGSAELGTVTATLKIDYTNPAPQTQTIPVRAAVVGDLLYGKSVRFMKSPDGTFSPRSFTLRSRSKKEVEIRKVEDPDRLLKIEIVAAKGERAELNLTVLDPAKDYKGETKPHTLKVHTSDKDEPILEIPYTIGVKMMQGKDGPFLDKAGLKLDRIKNRKQ